MLKFIVRRIFWTIPVLLVVIFLTFTMMRQIGGNPFRQSERAVPAAVQRNLERKFNVDKPWYMQYAYYVKGVATLDLGPSLVIRGRGVNDIVRERAAAVPAKDPAEPEYRLAVTFGIREEHVGEQGAGNRRGVGGAPSGDTGDEPGEVVGPIGHIGLRNSEVVLVVSRLYDHDFAHERIREAIPLRVNATIGAAIGCDFGARLDGERPRTGRIIRARDEERDGGSA